MALISFVSLDQSFGHFGNNNHNYWITVQTCMYYTHTEITIVTIRVDRSHAKRKLEVKCY